MTTSGRRRRQPKSLRSMYEGSRRNFWLKKIDPSDDIDFTVSGKVKKRPSTIQGTRKEDDQAARDGKLSLKSVLHTYPTKRLLAHKARSLFFCLFN